MLCYVKVHFGCLCNVLLLLLLSLLLLLLLSLYSYAHVHVPELVPGLSVKMQYISINAFAPWCLFNDVIR